MRLRAPGDRKSSRARTNWLLRQLVGSDPKDLHVRVTWPGRRPATLETLEVVRADADAIRAENPALSPRAFEVVLARDAGARFSCTKTFVDELETSVLRFYAEVDRSSSRGSPPPRGWSHGLNQLRSDQLLTLAPRPTLLMRQSMHPRTPRSDH